MSYHDFAIALAWVAIGITFYGVLAQFLRALLRGIEGISLATWALFVLMGIFWISYGLVQHSALIILGSLLPLPLQIFIVLRLKPWRSMSVIGRAFAYAFVFSIMPIFLWGWSGGVYGTGVAMVINRGPQLLELVRHEGAKGVSVAMWLLSGTAGIGWVLYYQNEHLMAPLISTACAAVVSFIIAVLAVRRHRQARFASVATSLAFATA